MNDGIRPMNNSDECRLSLNKLYSPFPASRLPFDSTEEIESFEGVIEQERAVSALTLGLKVNRRNYNIYVSGESGTGKTSIAKSLIPKISEKMPVPDDWCYVHNFKRPESPIAISLPAGRGVVFRKEMEKFVSELKNELPKAFHAKEHQEKIQRILNRSLDRESEIFLELTKKAATFGFQIKSTKTGIVTIPMSQEKPLDNQEYAGLSDEERHSIEKERQNLDPLISDFLQKTRDIEIDAHREIQKIQRSLGEAVIERCLAGLHENLKDGGQIENFLKAVSEDILENLPRFLPEESEAKNHQKKGKQNFSEYQVNVVVDNGDLKGAPVIYELTPNYYNLIGRIEKRVEQGIYSTDLTMIKAGSIARANGGFLILQAHDLLRNPLAWDALKIVLKNQKLIIEDIGEHLSFLPTSGLRPDPIPVRCKVVMIGGNDIYFLLYRYDEDFRKLFQVKADFDEEISRNSKTALEYARFIATTCRNDGLRHVTKEGVASLIEFGARLVEAKNKMTLKFNDIYNILIEANHHAGVEGGGLISKKHIESAIA
ncbi:MAG: AAA family ATPase, partial [Deltaproteobacteria bacterium]|nr:AAA family ATPase [Deltaproteobacteria bacterium]